MLRDTARQMIAYYTEQLDLSGDVLEIGGYRLSQCAAEHFPEPRFKYHSLDLSQADIPNTIVADITDCRAEIPDNSFDVVWSSDVFEHIDRPWLAAAEISRILKPGGIAFTHTLWSWRNHPCPIDYWRYSPECLEFLFSGLDPIEKGYDLIARRNNNMGFWQSGRDSVPVDAFGGFRENWAVFLVGTKGPAPEIVPFKDSDHPLARFLRMDTQGTVTNPRMKGGSFDDPLDGSGAIRLLEKTLSQVLDTQAKTSRQLQALDRRVIGMGQPLALRAYRKLRRRMDS